MITQRNFDIAANIEEGTGRPRSTCGRTRGYSSERWLSLWTGRFIVSRPAMREGRHDPDRDGTGCPSPGPHPRSPSPAGDYSFRRVEGDTIPDLSDELPRKRVRDQRIA